MKKFALTCAAVLALAAPAFAQSTTEIAIMHFNMDAESSGDIRMHSGEIVMIDSSDNAALAEALERFNMSADSDSDLRGLDGVTVIVPNQSNAAAEIFRRLMAEDDSN